MRNVQAFVVAMVAMLAFAAPGVARADVNGEWQTDLGVFTLQLPPGAAPNVSSVLRSSSAPYAPPGNGRTTLDGTYRNLGWKGRWLYFGTSPFPRMSLCPNTHESRLGTTRYYGSFMVTFNAAENAFTGTMTNCDVALSDTFRSRPFGGTRRNTLTGPPPTTRAPTGGITTTPGGDGLPPVIDATPAGFDPCRDRNRLAVTFSTAFASRPCIIAVTQQLQIDALVNGSQRPTTVIFRGFARAPTTFGSRINIAMTGQTFRLGLPNRGLPTVSTPFRVTLPGGVCRDDFWLVYLLMSDGTETDAIGVVNSMCGPTAARRGVER